MNRYKSRYRWRKVETGAYLSPDGKYGAHKRSDGRWRLCRMKWDAGVGWCDYKGGSTHLSLADCQEIAANMEATRQVMAKLEGERP